MAMYVCICFAVTESQIADFAQANGCNWRKLTRELKAGTQCGTCAKRAKLTLEKACNKTK
jgi:bacterioferritin-associated ferredoxin